MRSRTLLVVVAALVLMLAFATIVTVGPSPAAPTAKPPEQPTSLPGAPAAHSTDWYELYFTSPIYPDRPEGHRGGIDEKLVATINAAQKTIDAADYDFDLENVARALAVAKARGVRVRFVTDTDTWSSTNGAVARAWTILRGAEIPVVDDQRGPIMHHKFMVLDGEWVWTGSWNWTVGDTYRLNNNAIKIRSPELAADYTAEFEKMFVQRTFGPAKPKSLPRPPLTIGGATIESYFSPEDGVGARIVARVAEAQTSIQFLAFSFTHDAIGKALVARHQAGIPVRGVFETTGSRTPFSEFGPLKSAGIEVYTDGNPYVMHHKLFVIDGRTVMFGSFNFSSNADKDNDENLLILDDPTIARAFLTEVERVVATAKNPPVRTK